MKYKHLLVLLMIFACYSSAFAQIIPEVRRNEYKKLEVYFVSWDTMTRAALTVVDIKKTCDVHMTVGYEFLIRNIAQVIRAHSFKENKSGLYEDARLVLEFTREDGGSEVYYASNNKLLSGDSKKISDLDERLLQELNVFTKNRL